jgi:hypothetical protein
MNDDEKRIAEAVYGAIQDTSRYSERSQQAAEFRVGVSDLGFCSERVRRMLDQQEPEHTDVLKAWIGTALGDYMEQAMLRVWPHGIRQSEVSIVLQGEERVYTLTGHPDFIVPDEGILIDAKTDYGLSSVAKTGPNQQQQFQRHCYAKAAWLMGMFAEGIALEDVRVANVWLDRAGIDQGLHVQMEKYDEDLVTQAGLWLDDVVYAYLQGEEARKEPPRDMCAVICGFFPVCRAYDTDVEGLLTDKDVLTHVDMYREGLDLEKQGKRLKDQAKQHLVGVTGSTGEFMVRWTHINDTEVPATTRRGYDKLEVRALPKRKVTGK